MTITGIMCKIAYKAHIISTIVDGVKSKGKDGGL